jgi:hypothetical protein
MRPAVPRTLVWCAWKWPQNWRIKPHSRGIGLELVDYVPEHRTTFIRDEVTYTADWTFSALGHELLDCPEWLLDHLGKPA